MKKQDIDLGKLARLPMWPVAEGAYVLARSLNKRGFGEKSIRLINSSLLMSPARKKSLRRMFKIINSNCDPNSASADDHQGIQRFHNVCKVADLPLLTRHQSNLIAYSSLKQGFSLDPEFLALLRARSDPDALLMQRLLDKRSVRLGTDADCLFSHYQLPSPPYCDTKTGVDSFGFPGCNPVLGERVTVSMTARNAETTIRHAIASVLNQTWRNLEVIIVDDASDDATPAIIRDVMAADNRVHYLRNESSIGTYCSKNRALAIATGEWFTCHDADDWSHPMKIERQVAAIRSKASVASMSRWLRIDDSGEVKLWSPGELIHRNHSSLMFRTQKVRSDLGFYDSVRVSADAEILDRIEVAYGDRSIVELDDLLAMGRRHSAGLTSNKRFYVGFGRISEDREIYKRHFTRWHKTADRFYVPQHQVKRLFQAPADMVVRSIDLGIRDDNPGINLSDDELSGVAVDQS